MNTTFEKSFVYLSQILGLKVIDYATGKTIGKSSDVAAVLKDMYPRVTGLVVRRRFSLQKDYIPWKDVKRIIDEKAIYVETTGRAPFTGMKFPENEIMLKDIFLDQQVVDVSGSKVVRVNDLHMLREKESMWLVHMDVGYKGLVRRLGIGRLVEKFMRWLFSYEMKDRLISWKFVQPIISETGGSAYFSVKTQNMNLSDLHPADIADILEGLGINERIAVLKSLDTESAARTFQELPMKIRVQIAGLIAQDQMVNLINAMAMDEVVDLLSELPKKKIHAILARLPLDKSSNINDLLKHSENIAGGIMNTEFISAKQAETVAAVLDRIRMESKKKESIYYVYVLDDSLGLIGVVTLRQLLVNPSEKTIAEIMRKRVAKVRIETNIKDVAEVFQKYDFSIVPVVDKQNKIQGTITIKDAFEAAFRKEIKETEEKTEFPA
jgi:CBS domain-containing protein